MKNNVIVLAAGPNGLGVVRGLHLKKVKVSIITRTQHDVSNDSKLPKHKHLLHGSNEEQFTQLLDVLQSQPQNTVIIPTSDWFVTFLSQHTEQLKVNCLFTLPPVEVSELLIDKALETEFISTVAPIPKTIQKITDQESLLSSLSLPIIIKPRSHKHMVLGKKNILLYSQQDVDEFFVKFSDKLIHLIAQQVILGKDDTQWVCNCVFDHQSNLVQAFTFNRLRLSPSHYGVTSYAISKKNQRVIELSQKIGKALNYSGPAMVEFKLDRTDDEYKYIEINPRLGMCNYFDTVCGVNNTFATFQLANNQDIASQTEMRDGVIFLSFFEDFYSRKSDGESFFSILKDYARNMLKPHVFIYFVWWDPKPALILALRQLTQLIRSLYKKVFN